MILLLTGATSGIGWETLKGLYSEATTIILPVRNLTKAKKMLSSAKLEAKTHCVEMDLTDLKSVKNAGEQILKSFSKIDIQINNAGGMFPAGQLTKNGFDQSFQVNHLGHFLLTKTILPALLQAKGRIVNVSSEAHRLGKVNLEDLGLLKSSNTLSAYANAKLYNIYFSKGLKDQFGKQGLNAYSLHPGAVKTAFGSDSGSLAKSIIRVTQLFFISPAKGAQTSIFLSLSPKEKLHSGAYYDKKKLKSSSTLSMNQDLRQKLWEFSEACLDQALSE